VARTYPRLVGANKIKDEYGKINTIAQYAEETEARVDNILSEPDPNKDPELVDIRTPDSSYTPQRAINVAGDITRDMQAQFTAHKAEAAQGTGNFARYIFGTNARGTIGWEDGVNNTVKSGFYFIHTNLEGLPIPSSGHMIQVQNDAQDGFALQFFHDNWSNQLFVRRKTSGTFQDWYELMPLYRGAGNPEGVIAAKPGSFYLRDSGELWVKKTGTGNTGWGQVTVS
jgi:hypothetical protein